MWKLAVQNSDELIYIWSLYTCSDSIAACFPFEPLEKCMTFKDIFPGLSRTLSFNFQDFPGGVGNLHCFFIHFTSVLWKQFAANDMFLREANSYK